MPIWNRHPQAQQVKVHYLFTCNLLEELLFTLKEYYAAESGKAKITNFSLPQTKMQLRKKQRELAVQLQKLDIDNNLIDLLLNGIQQHINKKNLAQNEVQFINELINLIIDRGVLDTLKLIDLIILMDFNLPEFFLYCVERWDNQLAEVPGLHEQRELLLTEKNKLYELVLKRKKISSSKPGLLYHDLNDFLNEKYAFVSQLVKLRREAIRDIQEAKEGRRFLVNLPVPQFGLFIRMQIEKGLLAKENVGEIFSFFATHFYTANATYISADSLQKKSTDVEFSTAQKMKGHLIGMLNWLNTNYNLSNYN